MTLPYGNVVWLSIYIRITKEVTSVIKEILEVLYIDPQAAVPVGFCPCCGGERYAPEGPCPRCERRSP